MTNENLNREDILKTEYSENFDELRKDRMATSYFKYGPVTENYKKLQCILAIESLEKRLKMYKDTGNMEFLCDIANFAMIEFMCPQHHNAHFKVLDDGKSHIIGIGVNEIGRFQNGIIKR
jgi:hypothetical protein